MGDVVIFAALLAGVQVAPPPRPTYPQARRCAALVWAEIRASDDPEAEMTHFDSSLYWSLAAAEIAREQKLTSAQFAAEQDRARADATRDRAAGTATGEFAACVASVPSPGG